jgi:hypothetical protein
MTQTFIRLDGWEARLLDAIGAHLSAPFAYGASDCFALSMDAIKAVTGVDPYAEDRASYSTAHGAAKRLARRGFATLEDAMDALFEPVPQSLARRGDIATIMAGDGPALAVVIGGEFISKAETGIMRHPLWMAMKTWRVG